MKLKGAMLAAAAALMVTGMAATTYAVTFEEWYYGKYGSYPAGTLSDWMESSTYYEYLADTDYVYYDGTTYYYTDDDGSTYYYYTDDDAYEYYYYYDYDDTKYYVNVTDAYWSGRTAKWTIDGSASKYQVKLYRDDKCVDTRNVTGKSCSFSSSMDRDGYYYFKVKAYNKNIKSWSDWYESDDRYFSASSSGGTTVTNNTTTTVSSSGGPGSQWIQATDGTGRWWFRHADGTYTKNGWELINSKWYYFDEIGWMKTGWLTFPTGMYYLGPDGAMVTGNYTVDGVAHCFSPDGALLY